MTKLVVVALALAALASAACMTVPIGTHVFVSDRGCTSSGVCPFGGGESRNFYWESTGEVVLAPNQSLKVLAHELCHAHQAWTVFDETGKNPTTPGLVEWYDTKEAWDFNAVVVATQPRPWAYLSDDMNLEDFATSCAMWLTDPDGLRALSPERAKFLASDLQ